MAEALQILLAGSGITWLLIAAAAVLGAVWGWVRSGREVREGGRPAYPHGVRILWSLTGACALAGIAAVFGISPLMAAEYVALMVVLLAVAITDVARFTIPNRYVVAVVGIWVAFTLAKLALVVGLGGTAADVLQLAADLVAEALLGAAVAGGPVLVLTLIMGAAGKKAMGGGDIKLLFAVGLFFTWRQNLLALLLACLVAVVMGLVRRARTGASTMAFGAAIAAGWLLMLVTMDPLDALLWL